jgi:hypothetical protein
VGAIFKNVLNKLHNDVLPSILACSVERWTGFGKMPSSAGTVPPQLLKTAPHRNRSSVQPNKQESTEGHRGKSLSCGNNYFQDFNKVFFCYQNTQYPTDY